MYDKFNREINYLRISVTDRCNLRCLYCMPEEGIPLLHHSDILTFDEIYEFTALAVERGVTKVRVTGGEPLVRRGIVGLIGMLSGINGITDLSMTTNGVLLSSFAQELKEAGLMRVNVSLDTVNPARFSEITRGGVLADVLDGIRVAQEVGLIPVKINCVIRNSGNEPDAMGVKKFCEENNLEIRYIRQMDLVKGHFSTVEGGTGGNCSICNRLRLTSDGKLKPCLFNKIGFDIRELGFEKALSMAIDMKPECGSNNDTGTFYNIGG
jgi:cyclic pyranopterin phosphate synthase